MSDNLFFINPFRDMAKQYREKGFAGILPLPYKMKESPPSSFTGKRAPYPTKEDIERWVNDGQKHNICIRLAGVDKDYEIIGIDVDDYMKGTKKKNGGDQLSNLEKELGVLPKTWISTSRLDGVSGIRLYRVPRGLVFRGKADKDIEIIQKGHRYTLVYPSIHPEGGIYRWWEPGIVPTRENLDNGLWKESIPNAATDFPLLPDAWIDFLSNNRMLMPKGDALIDMESTVDEIYDWATDTFYRIDDDEDGDEVLCDKMQEKLDKHLLKIENSNTFHDLIVNAHWNLLNLALEGHLGWNKALNIVEKAWVEAVMKRGGTTERDYSTMNREVFRSRAQALRQIKAIVDERKKIGADALSPMCIKVGICGTKGNVSNDGIVDGGMIPNIHTMNVMGSNGVVSPGSGGPIDPVSDVPQGGVGPMAEYTLNDDGNAQHLYDRFCHIVTGPSMRYIKNYGWIVWHNGIREESSGSGSVGDYIDGYRPHWEVDKDGDHVMRRLWKKVKEHQEACVENMYNDYQAEILNAINQGLPTGGMNAPQDLIRAKRTYEKWSKFVEKSGNNRQADEAIKAARSLPYVRKDIEELDSNPFLLGVANGVVELGDEIRLREAQLNDFITLNTNVPWHEGKVSAYAKNVWQDYLDTFLPDPEIQKAVQVAFGYSLIGGNPEKKIFILKGETNTGKSTFINALRAAMGDYAQSVNQSVFQNHKLNPVLGNALKKRLIVCSEFDEKDQLSASQVKRLTGSTDGLQVEMKNQNETIESEAHFVAALATNEVPGIKGSDKALENRLHVIPFNVSPKRLKKMQGNAIIASSTTAILAWLIDGYKEYRRLGDLPITAEMEQAKKQFVGELDEVGAFINECVIDATSPQQYVSRKAMYEKFQQWWIEDNQQMNQIPSMSKFTRTMKAKGHKTKEGKFRVNGQLDYWWIGVRIGKKRSNVISMPNFGVPNLGVRSEDDAGGVPEISGTNDGSGTDENGL